MQRNLQFFVANLLIWSLTGFLLVLAVKGVGWPWWVYLWGWVISFVLFLEIVARLGRERFETPIRLLLKESGRDRVAISSAVFGFLIVLSILPPIFFKLKSSAIYIPFFFGILLVPNYLILYFGGSEKLRNAIVPKRIKEAGLRDRIVILLGYLTTLIVFSIIVSLEPIWLSITAVFITGYISPLFEFIFGSPKLRDEVTPKWLKNLFWKPN